MELSTCLILPRATAVDIHVAGKRELLRDLAERAAAAYVLDAAMVREALEERELLGSTGFGGGVAIPHARVAGIERPVGLCVRLDRAIGFDAVDELPVDIVFCLLSPADGGAVHLKALAEVSRALRDKAFAAKLRGAADEAAFYALWAGHEERDAA